MKKLAIHVLDKVKENRKDARMIENVLFEHDSHSSFEVFANPLFDPCERVLVMSSVDFYVGTKNMHDDSLRFG